jgi:hypothetical protein
LKDDRGFRVAERFAILTSFSFAWNLDDAILEWVDCDEALALGPGVDRACRRKPDVAYGAGGPIFGLQAVQPSLGCFGVHHRLLRGIQRGEYDPPSANGRWRRLLVEAIRFEQRRC